MSAPAVVDLRNSFGAAFIGLLLSTTLFGLTLAQAWIYFWHYWNKDSKALKISIVFITAMETFHAILCAYMIYWYLVLNFGNVENLGNSMWAIDIQAGFQSIYITAVHYYYARRIYIVSKSIFLLMVIVITILGSNIIGIYVAVKQLGHKQISWNGATWLPYVGLSGIVVVDALIATMMCWSLYRKRTGFARTDSLIMTLMAYTINSGLVSCLLGIGVTICFAVAPSTLYSLAFFLVLGKCYVNSILAMLNSRNYVRDRLTTDNPDNAFNLSSIQIDAQSEAYGAKSRQSDVSVTLHHSTASEFARSKSGYNVELTSEVPKLDTTTIPSQAKIKPRIVGSSHDHGAT